MKERGLDVCSQDKKVCFYKIIQNIADTRFRISGDLKIVRDELKALLDDSIPRPEQYSIDDDIISDEPESEECIKNDSEEEDGDLFNAPGKTSQKDQLIEKKSRKDEQQLV